MCQVKQLVNPRTIAIVIGHGSTNKSPRESLHIRFQDFYSFYFFSFLPVLSSFVLVPPCRASFVPETYFKEDRESRFSLPRQKEVLVSRGDTQGRIPTSNLTFLLLLMDLDRARALER